MVENRPFLTFLSHFTVIVGLVLIAFPVWMTFVASTHDQATMLRSPVPLMPMVRETIEALSGNVRLAIVTGSPRDKVMLMHGDNGLLDYFEVIVTDDEISNAKPHPEPYLKAMEMLGVEPSRCLAVEDSRRGLDSAVAAGLRCIAVPNALTRIQRFERAFAVEDDASGVLKHLRRMNRAIEID